MTADLVSMNETFLRARTIFDRMMEESLARHTGSMCFSRLTQIVVVAYTLQYTISRRTAHPVNMVQSFKAVLVLQWAVLNRLDGVQTMTNINNLHHNPDMAVTLEGALHPRFQLAHSRSLYLAPLRFLDNFQQVQDTVPILLKDLLPNRDLHHSKDRFRNTNKGPNPL